jgi:soluble lytic murein transglycosylase-like protein
MNTYLIAIILNAAKAASVPGWLFLAICNHESGLVPSAIVHNDGGSPSIGLCQIKKGTAQSLGFKGTQKDLLNPKTNAKYAALYLKSQLNKYGSLCKGVAAYNSGTYNEHKIQHIPRNIKYVHKIQALLDNDKKELLNCRKQK